MSGKCMVNHELEEGLFFTLMDRHRETQAMLKRAVEIVKTAASEIPYWDAAEEFLRDAQALLERTDPGEMEVWQPGEEPF